MFEVPGRCSLAHLLLDHDPYDSNGTNKMSMMQTVHAMCSAQTFECQPHLRNQSKVAGFMLMWPQAGPASWPSMQLAELLRHER